MSFRFRLRVCAQVAIVLLTAALARSEPSELRSTIEHVNSLRHLSAAEAGRGYAVRIRGVVTALSGWKNSFFLEQSGVGISVDRTDQVQVHSGDYVEVAGKSGKGSFAPIILADHVRVLGKAELPVAKRATYAELVGGQEDSQWVEIRGVIQSATVSESWGRPTMFINIDTGAGSIVARLRDFPPSGLSNLIDATVQVRGVCGTNFNQKRQFVGLRLFVPGLAEIKVEEPAPADPFAVSTSRIGDVFQFGSPQALKHRVRMSGVVTYRSGGLLYLQSGRDAIAVQVSGETNVQAGERIEAAGFVSAGEYSPQLKDALIRKIGSGDPPSPVPVQAAEVIRKSSGGFNSAPYDGVLIEVQAEVLSEVQSGERQVWLLRSGGKAFQAVLQAEGEAEQVQQIRDGSEVKLTGICAVEADQSHEPRAFQILLRSRKDVLVVRTPLWSVSRSLWLIVFLILISLGMLFWILQLRRAIAAEAPQHAPAGSDVTSHLLAASGRIGFVAVAISSIVLLGRYVLPVVTGGAYSQGGNNVPASSALAIALLGCALWIKARRTSNRVACVIGIAAAVAAGLIGFFLLREHTSIAGLLLLLGGGALFLQIERTRSSAHVAAVLASILCLFTIVGYLYGIRQYHGISFTDGGTLITALLGSMLACGLLLSSSDRGLMITITSLAPGGIMTRRLLPAALIIPAALGWVRLQGQLRGGYDTEFGLALFACANIVVFSALTWTNGWLLNRLDVGRSHAESRLRESEKRFRTILESLPQMVWTCLPTGACDYLSRQWVSYTGIPEPAQLDFGWTQQVHPDDRMRMKEHWFEAVRTSSNFDVEYRVRGSNGDYRWFRALAVPLRDATGAVTKWFGTSTDIEAVKQGEAEIRELNRSLENRVRNRTAQLLESEARFRYLVEGVKDYAIVTLDADGFLTSWNSGAERIGGYTAEEVIGKHFSAFYTEEDQRSGHPGQMLQTAEREGRFEEERWLVRKDGSVFLADCVMTRLTDKSGRLRGFSKITRDITERKRTEAEVERTRAKLQAVLDAAIRVSIVEVNPEGVIELFSAGAEQMLQYSASEVVNVERRRREGLRLATDVEPGNEPVGMRPPVLEAGASIESSQQRRSEEREWTYMRKDGSQVEVSLAVTAVRNRSGEIEGYVEAATDITARKALERELRQNNERLLEQTRTAEKANYAKSEFLAVISHEIRTPMNAILGMAEVLRDSGVDEEQRHYIEVLQRAGNNLMQLINDILDASKIEAGHLELEQIEFDLRKTIEEAVEVVAAKAHEKGLELIVRVAANVPTPLVGDPTRLRQILINLLGNAVKFTERGYVSVQVANDTSSVPGWIDFEISDTGIGVPAEKLETIFGDFTQADSSVTRKYGGTGLGLGISRRLVEFMGGQLTVTSRVGEGSTFRFTARFGVAGGGSGTEGYANLDEVTGQDREPVASSEAVGGMKILVADDSPDNRELIEIYLKDTLHALTFAEDGQEALQQFETQRFDLVFMDIQMPLMDGLTATRAMRRLEEDRKLAATPIVALSANARPEDVEMSRMAGCDAHLSKPISKKRLLAAVEEYGKPRTEPSAGGRDAPETIEIEMPEGLEKRVPVYLASRKNELQTLAESLAASDFQKIQVLAHNIKGTGASYGFEDLTNLGAAMEESAKDEDTMALQRDFAALEEYLSKVRLR